MKQTSFKLQPPESPVWGELANAVILAAVDDYKSAYRKYKRTGDKSDLKVLEKFFYGEVYGSLINLPPEAILDRVRKEIDNE